MSKGSGGGGSDPLLPTKSPFLTRCPSRPDDELARFRSCLQWMCLDQSGTLRTLLSWCLFLFLAVGVPIFSHFVLLYSDHRRPYDTVVQLSLTVASSISFVCLSASYRKYGLRRLLFLDKVSSESKRVQRGYVTELHRSFRILAVFVMPCFVAECGYKIWWYLAGARRIPFLGNEVASDAVACALELASWIYRTVIFFLVCVLFRLICYLQILRLQDFTTVFQDESEVAAVLRGHLKIRRQLIVISHMYRQFILAGLILVTASQFAHARVVFPMLRNQLPLPATPLLFPRLNPYYRNRLSLASNPAPRHKSLIRDSLYQSHTKAHVCFCIRLH